MRIDHSMTLSWWYLNADGEDYLLLEFFFTKDAYIGLGGGCDPNAFVYYMVHMSA